MKKLQIIFAVLLFCSGQADACVGKVINIGVMQSAEGQVLSEVIGALITERTGTSVAIKMYPSSQELYEAVKMKQVDISVENTSRALRVLNRAAEPDAKKAYQTAKEAYEREMGLIWMKPFGYTGSAGGGPPSHTAAILRTEILTNFPALPRVLDKLSSAITDEAYTKLVKSVESGEKANKVARDFLKSKKLI